MAEIKLDYGLNIATTAPVDKRIVVEKLSDLYDKTFFDYVYAGLTVSVVNTLETVTPPENEGDASTYTYNTGGMSLWQLVNVEPYNFGSTTELTHDNFQEYWQRVAGSSQTTNIINNNTTTTMYWDDLDSSDAE